MSYVAKAVADAYAQACENAAQVCKQAIKDASDAIECANVKARESIQEYVENQEQYCNSAKTAAESVVFE